MSLGESKEKIEGKVAVFCYPFIGETKKETNQINLDLTNMLVQREKSDIWMVVFNYFFV